MRGLRPTRLSSRAAGSPGPPLAANTGTVRTLATAADSIALPYCSSRSILDCWRRLTWPDLPHVQVLATASPACWLLHALPLASLYKWLHGCAHCLPAAVTPTASALTTCRPDRVGVVRTRRHPSALAGLATELLELLGGIAQPLPPNEMACTLRLLSRTWPPTSEAAPPCGCRSRCRTVRGFVRGLRSTVTRSSGALTAAGSAAQAYCPDCGSRQRAWRTHVWWRGGPDVIHAAGTASCTLTAEEFTRPLGPPPTSAAVMAVWGMMVTVTAIDGDGGADAAEESSSDQLEGLQEAKERQRSRIRRKRRSRSRSSRAGAASGGHGGPPVAGP